MIKLQYHACKGSATDIEAMDKGTYFNFCAILDNYLEKCKIEKEAMDKFMNKNKPHGRGNK